MAKFMKLNDQLEVSALGDNRLNRITIFRSIGNLDPIDIVTDTRVLIIGGRPTIKALKELISSTPRHELQELLPAGMSVSTHTAVRQWLGLSRKAK